MLHARNREQAHTTPPTTTHTHFDRQAAMRRQASRDDSQFSAQNVWALNSKSSRVWEAIGLVDFLPLLVFLLI